MCSSDNPPRWILFALFSVAEAVILRLATTCRPSLAISGDNSFDGMSASLFAQLSLPLPSYSTYGDDDGQSVNGLLCTDDGFPLALACTHTHTPEHSHSAPEVVNVILLPNFPSDFSSFFSFVLHCTLLDLSKSQSASFFDQGNCRLKSLSLHTCYRSLLSH